MTDLILHWGSFSEGGRDVLEGSLALLCTMDAALIPCLSFALQITVTTKPSSICLLSSSLVCIFLSFQPHAGIYDSHCLPVHVDKQHSHHCHDGSHCPGCPGSNVQ